MRVPRIYTPHPLSESHKVGLDEKGIKHVREVLRLSVGHQVILFNGDGYNYLGEIVESQKRGVSVLIQDQVHVEFESSLQIHLLQPLCRSDKMDWCLQKATELGVSAITPFISSRVNFNLPPKKVEKKLTHWQSVIHSACEQCGRAIIPLVRAPVEYQTLIASLPKHSHKIIANPHQATTHTHNPEIVSEHQQEVICAVGPEGGFSPEEIQLSLQHSFQSQRLGPRILRLETAVVTLLTMTQARFGDLN